MSRERAAATFVLPNNKGDRHAARLTGIMFRPELELHADILNAVIKIGAPLTTPCVQMSVVLKAGEHNYGWPPCSGTLYLPVEAPTMTKQPYGSRKKILGVLIVCGLSFA